MNGFYFSKLLQNHFEMKLPIEMYCKVFHNTQFDISNENFSKMLFWCLKFSNWKCSISPVNCALNLNINRMFCFFVENSNKMMLVILIKYGKCLKYRISNSFNDVIFHISVIIFPKLIKITDKKSQKCQQSYIFGVKFLH